MHFPAEALTALVVLQPESQLLNFSHPVVVVLSLISVLVLVGTAMGIRRPNAVQTRIRHDVRVAEHNPQLAYGSPPGDLGRRAPELRDDSFASCART